MASDGKGGKARKMAGLQEIGDEEIVDALKARFPSKPDGFYSELVPMASGKSADEALGKFAGERVVTASPFGEIDPLFLLKETDAAKAGDEFAKAGYQFNKKDAEAAFQRPGEYVFSPDYAQALLFDKGDKSLKIYPTGAYFSEESLKKLKDPSMTEFPFSINGEEYLARKTGGGMQIFFINSTDVGGMLRNLEDSSGPDYYRGVLKLFAEVSRELDGIPFTSQNRFSWSDPLLDLFTRMLAEGDTFRRHWTWKENMNSEHNPFAGMEIPGDEMASIYLESQKIALGLGIRLAKAAPDGTASIYGVLAPFAECSRHKELVTNPKALAIVIEAYSGAVRNGPVDFDNYIRFAAQYGKTAMDSGDDAELGRVCKALADFAHHASKLAGDDISGIALHALAAFGKDGPQDEKLLLERIALLQKMADGVASRGEIDFERFFKSFTPELHKWPVLDAAYAARLEKMHKYCGVFELYRLQPEKGDNSVIDKLIETYENPSKNASLPLSVVTMPREGSTGFYDVFGSDLFCNLVSDLTKGYRVAVFSTACPQAIDNAVNNVEARFGKPVEYLFMGGHGQSDHLNLSRFPFFGDVPLAKAPGKEGAQTAFMDDSIPFTLMAGAFPARQGDAIFDMNNPQHQKIIGRLDKICRHISFIACDVGKLNENGTCFVDKFGERAGRAVIAGADAPIMGIKLGLDRKDFHITGITFIPGEGVEKVTPHIHAPKRMLHSLRIN